MATIYIYIYIYGAPPLYNRGGKNAVFGVILKLIFFREDGEVGFV